MKKRIGIIGGGQLGRLLAEAARPLGFHVSILDPTPKSPAGRVADLQIVADYKDSVAIEKLALQINYLTFEIELADSDVLDTLQKRGISVNPSGKTLSIIKDKFEQKKFLRARGIPVGDFIDVKDRSDIERAIEVFKYPVFLKARFDAYDGRGNALIEKPDDIESALRKLADRDLYVEQYVPFEKEIAVIAARGMDGTVMTYPVVQTIHKNNICHVVIAPAVIDNKSGEMARRLAEDVLKHFSGAGVFGIEMFLTQDGQILINEIAPRVHNSGHHTIESSITSQFEQHIRAITGMPLEDTAMKTPHAVMINILGDRNGPAKPRGVSEANALPGVSVHMYDKIETRLERKMGHVTAIGKTAEEAMELAKRARSMISI